MLLHCQFLMDLYGWQEYSITSASLDSVSGVDKLLKFIYSHTICCGNADEKFLILVSVRKGKVQVSMYDNYLV